MAGSGEAVIARAARVLSVFEPGRTEVGVAEIARLTGLHVATASRIVAQLVEHGLLARSGSGRVRVGTRLWELGQRASPASLLDAARPYLEDLHAVVGHHVQIGVLDGDEVIFLERLSAPGAVINLTRVAGRLPLHASSSGLVLLAHAPAAVQERVLAADRFERFTPATPTDPRGLRTLLADVRRDDAVVTDGFIHPDATGVAVPVRDRGGSVVAALSTIQPNDGRAHALIPALRAAAFGIRRALVSR